MSRLLTITAFILKSIKFLTSAAISRSSIIPSFRTTSTSESLYFCEWSINQRFRLTAKTRDLEPITKFLDCNFFFFFFFGLANTHVFDFVHLGKLSAKLPQIHAKLEGPITNPGKAGEVRMKLLCSSHPPLYILYVQSRPKGVLIAPPTY